MARTAKKRRASFIGFLPDRGCRFGRGPATLQYNLTRSGPENLLILRQNTVILCHFVANSSRVREIFGTG